MEGHVYLRVVLLTGVQAHNQLLNSGSILVRATAALRWSLTVCDREDLRKPIEQSSIKRDSHRGTLARICHSEARLASPRAPRRAPVSGALAEVGGTTRALGLELTAGGISSWRDPCSGGTRRAVIYRWAGCSAVTVMELPSTVREFYSFPRALFEGANRSSASWNGRRGC